MQIGKAPGFIGKAVSNIGRTMVNGGASSRGKLLNGVNKLVQGEGINPGRAAYYFLMTACVLFPRLIQAREPDEFREIMTRDVITILTMLFAIEAMNARIATSAQKRTGIVLTSDTVGKNASPIKRALGYMNPEGGIMPLDSDEIIARYSGIKDKKTLVKTLNMVDKEGGDIGKMFAVEKREGFLSKIMKKLPFGKKDKGTPLYDAAKKMFGGEFEGKTNAELIEAVQNISKDNKQAYEGLEEIIGSTTFKRSGKDFKQGILNNKNNPITYYARNLSANTQWLSLAGGAAFIGYGLPKFNEQLTIKIHRKELEEKARKASNPETQTGHALNITDKASLYGTMNAEEQTAFRRFLA